MKTKYTHNLGLYYQYVIKDHKMMKKYYPLAIKNNCIKSMYNLG